MKFPSRVELCGPQDNHQNTNYSWKTKEGIGIGTSLQELEKLNGKSFNLLSFGSEIGGQIKNWSLGKLNSFQSENPQLVLYLSSPLNETAYSSLSQKEKDSLVGDQEISSSLALIQKMNPRVMCMTLFFK